MADYEVGMFDASGVSIVGNQVTITGGLGLLGIDDDGPVFAGDLGANEQGMDLNQFLADTTTRIYLEEGYTVVDTNGVEYTMFRVELQGGTLHGYTFLGDTPPPFGTYTITSTFNVGDHTAGNGPRFDYPDFIPACFVRGSMIETDRGAVAIEELQAGDMVRTLDHGFQPIRWIGSSKAWARGNMAPIRLAKGAMGNTRDLLVSPKHRMLLQGWQLEMLFDSREALVTADSLLNDSTITRAEGGVVEYFHMMFDRHQIVFAEGCPSESFYPATAGLDKLAEATRNEILELFPQLVEDLESYGPAARDTLKADEAALLRQPGRAA